MDFRLRLEILRTTAVAQPVSRRKSDRRIDRRNGAAAKLLIWFEPMARAIIMASRWDVVVLFLGPLVSLLVTICAAQVRGLGQASSQSAKADRPQMRSALPLTEFYSTPKPLPPGKPGELIRAEEFTGYALPSGVVAVRILYHSRSATEQDVATSGVVLYPDEKPPVRGWPVIAWAHELNGVARQCAPSLARNLEHGPFLSMYASLGYAVVATDYTGLGADFRNAFLDIESNARDVIYSIPAARRAVPELGSEWIAMGYGEGGLTVTGIAESGPIVDSHYLGGIVIRGLAALKSPDRSPEGNPLNSPLFFAYGVKTVFPEFEVEDILTESALALYPKLGQGCSEPSLEPKSTSQMLKPNWQNNRFAEQYLERNTIGEKPARGPFLVIASEADSQNRDSGTAQVIAQMCKQGDRVQFEKYANPDPGNVIGESVRDQIAWIQGRFGGRPAPGNCPGQH
jgi:hypothetical protein